MCRATLKSNEETPKDSVQRKQAKRLANRKKFRIMSQKEYEAMLDEQPEPNNGRGLPDINIDQ